VSDPAERLAAAQRAWPTVAVPPERFVARLADLDDTEHATDLYLATGCLLGLPAALAAFETAHFGQVDAIVRRLRPSGVGADDVKQLVREKLFARPDASALAHYTGRGTLAGWFRVVVTRVVLNVTRGDKEQPAREDDVAVLDHLDPREGLELLQMRTLFDDHVRRAMPEAFAALSVQARLLVRQRHLDDLSLDQLAALHRVHVATIKRKLAAARDQLSTTLRAIRTRELAVSPEELVSILRMVQSRFHITVRRLLED
jgi:RNA polymerase sigma-70 factor, ECF subfamily